MTASDLDFIHPKIEIGAAYDHAKHCSLVWEAALSRF